MNLLVCPVLFPVYWWPQWLCRLEQRRASPVQGGTTRRTSSRKTAGPPCSYCPRLGGAPSPRLQQLWAAQGTGPASWPQSGGAVRSRGAPTHASARSATVALSAGGSSHSVRISRCTASISGRARPRCPPTGRGVDHHKIARPKNQRLEIRDGREGHPPPTPAGTGVGG